ncbi:HEAT repeat domain-containing protein [Synechococcus sp. M16CYN]
MAKHYATEAMPYLFSLLHSPDPIVYRTAVKGLGVLGHQTVPDIIQTFKSSDSSTIRACCIKVIVQISVNFPKVAFPPEIISILEQALDDSSPVVNQSALMTLGHLSKHDSEKKRTIDLLIQVCDKSNIAHIQGATMALAELDSPLASACLRKLASDNLKDPLVREVAKASLERRESLNLQ